MPLAKNSAGLYAVPPIKNLAGLVPGIGQPVQTWAPRLSRSVMYAPQNTLWFGPTKSLPMPIVNTPNNFRFKVPYPTKMPMMPPGRN